MADLDDEYHQWVQGALPALRRLAYVLCQDGHRADDLVQGALVKLYLGWERVRAAGNREAYARTVLVRVFLSERRGGWARRVVLVDRVPETGSAPPDAAAGVALRAALATLPPKQRAALVLRYYQDLSVDETAAALGVPANTVKSHTARGLAALRRALPEEAIQR